MNNISFLELLLDIDSIIIGERIKGGVFRPCQQTIPSSTIEGALRHRFNLEATVPAVGILEEGSYLMKEFVYGVQDRMLGNAKVPIFTNYLTPNRAHCEKIRAKIYIPDNQYNACKGISKNAEFYMGALKTKGFGKCRIIRMDKRDFMIKQGLLNVKVFSDEVKYFSIEPISPIYGLLFKPDPKMQFMKGTYQKSLFPESLVMAPEVFLKEERCKATGKSKTKEMFYDV